MTYEAALSMWNMTRGKFTEKVENLEEEQLTVELDGKSIGDLIYHTAEVEYIFADWFFDFKTTLNIPTEINTNKTALVQFLYDANDHFIEAMQQLDPAKWNEKVSSRMGETTPLEAVARLIYHTGIHTGQITTIQNITAKQK